MNKLKYLSAVFVVIFLAQAFGEITVDKISSQRPRLLVNPDLVEQIVSDIESQTQPRAGAWNIMKEDLQEKLDAGRDPLVYTGKEPFVFYKRCRADSEVARDMAYAYCITKEEKYADFALNYLRSWAEAEPMPAANFDPDDSAANASMLISRSMMQFVAVYDMLYEYPDFSQAAKRRAEKWFDNAVVEIKRGIKTWEQNDYYNYQYYQNHLVSDMLGLVFIGYATGDKELLQFAIDSEQNERDFMDLLNGIILIEGEQGYFREPGDWKVHNGEIWDRYRHFAIAGHTFDYITKPNRGLQYSHLSLTQMAIAAQAAYSNGLDLFSIKGDNGENLEESFEFYADFYRLKDSAIKGGFYFGESERIGKGGDDPSLWELAYMHYPDNQSIYELLISLDRPSHKMWLIGNPALIFGEQLKPLVADSIPENKTSDFEPQFAAYPPHKIKVPQIYKPHPRLMMDDDDISLIRQRVRGREKPFVDAWVAMKAELDDVIKSGTSPKPYTGEHSLEFFKAASKQSSLARDFAIAYHITGSERYARKAIDYLYSWSTANPMPATVFNPDIRFPNSGMEVARGSFGFLWAYDLMYNHSAMNKQRKARIEFWFRHLEKVIHEGVRRWDTPYKRVDSDAHPRGWVESDNPDDRYFGGQDYQNHITAHTMGLAAIGYTLGDRELVQYAVDSAANPRDFVELIEGAILMRGQEPRDKDHGNVQNGEIYDRYRHYQAPGKGLQYAHLSLLKIAVTAEMCFNNGLDFYNYTAPDGERIELPFSFYSDFYRFNDASIKGGFYSGETERIGEAGDDRALFELGLKRYPNNPKLRKLISKTDRAREKVWLLGRAVLTHGAVIDAADYPPAVNAE